MSTGTVSQWMINDQSLGLKKHSLVLELAEVYFFLSFCKSSNTCIFFKSLLCLSLASLMHLKTNVIVSCVTRGKVMKRHQSKCLSWQTKSFRMNIFPVF